MLKLITVLLLLPAIALAQPGNSFEKKEFISGTDTLRYRIQYPFNYTSTKKYPVVLMMHGSGERGNNNESQLAWGGNLFADSVNRASYPAIVLFPQCPANDAWARVANGERPADSSKRFRFLSDQPIGVPLSLVVKLLDSIVNAGLVDTKRIYVGGLSMGGMGTFEILWRKPGFFAAAFPICGAGDPDKVSIYANKFPVWVFHGQNDPVVGVSYSRAMVEALKNAKAKVKYTEYPGVKHDSWKNAFAEPELLNWLFKQKK